MKFSSGLYLDDHSRVKLSATDSDGKENYINANFIDVNLLRYLLCFSYDFHIGI